MSTFVTFNIIRRTSQQSICTEFFKFHYNRHHSCWIFRLSYGVHHKFFSKVK